MPFTEENKPLLEEAASINFQFMKNGMINYRKHSSYERGLFFIKKAIEIHENKYGYDKVEYVNNSTKVILTCRTHKDFEQIPSNHIRGWGCPKCANSLKASTAEDFIAKAREIYGDKYDYTSVRYQNNKEKIEIICYLHGSFFQTPNTHLDFHGCPRCWGQNHNILYLLKCLDTGWYKIGITTNDTKNRILSIGGNLKEVYHINLEDPRKHESILHKKYEKERKHNLCVKSGNTEFFSLTEDQAQEVISYMNEVSSNA